MVDVRPPRSDAKGSPIFEIAGFTFDTREDITVMRLGYQVNEQCVGQLPALALSAEQCAQLAGALQAQVLALKKVVPLKPRPKEH